MFSYSGYNPALKFTTCSNSCTAQNSLEFLKIQQLKDRSTGLNIYVTCHAWNKRDKWLTSHSPIIHVNFWTKYTYDTVKLKQISHDLQPEMFNLKTK